MKRRDFLKHTAGAGIAALGFPGAAQAAGTPNFVIILLDDSGWSDYKPFGHPSYPTPNLEQLAAAGCRFNNFYVPQAICSASRSALLSGCYPERTKVFGAHGPGARGLDPGFATMGQVLKQAGYRTAVFGKWHIGDQPETRPPARGFDESCGLMYSNDMWEFHPENPQNYKIPLQFWENGKVKVERMTPELQPMLTTWYTEHAVDFIKRNKANPFLLYVPHSMPHVPLFRSEKFKDKSGTGVYGDVMMEIDWSVGEILKALKDNGLDDNTLVILTSDNGPWTSYGNHAGTDALPRGQGHRFRRRHAQRLPDALSGQDQGRLGVEQGVLHHRSVAYHCPPGGRAAAQESHRWSGCVGPDRGQTRRGESARLSTPSAPDRTLRSA